MSSSHHPFFFFLVLFSFLHQATSGITCRDTCDPTQSEPSIRFPFRRVDEDWLCGYWGFELSCDNKNQTILSLPNSGNFTVQKIDYLSQTILINDPNSCLPRRFTESFKLTNTPFDGSDSVVYKFLNCPSNNIPTIPRSRVINCMSGDDFTVLAVPEYSYNRSRPLRTSCHEFKRVVVPVLWPSWSDRDLENGVFLRWNLPVCKSCEEQGGSCGFKNDVSGPFLHVGCDNLPRKGLPRSAKYGIIIGVAIPGLLCFIGIACYLCGRVGDYYHRRRGHSDTEFISTITPQSVIIITGLDKAIIESFPKTLLGESKRLPRPNDNTCSICLCEYQPKEILRSIPECNHYFHVNCIDEWLKLNATCPVCRNSPEGSATATPSASTPSSFSSSSVFLSS